MIVGKPGAAVLLVTVSTESGRQEAEHAELVQLVEDGYEVTHMTSTHQADRYLLRAWVEPEPVIAAPVDRMS